MAFDGHCYMYRAVKRVQARVLYRGKARQTRPSKSRPWATRRPCAPAPQRRRARTRRPGPASRPAKPLGPAGPHVRQQIEAGLPCVAAALHKAQVRQHAVHGLNAVRGHRMTRLSKLVGCALSLSVFLLWQSPPARKGLPHRTTWSSSQVRHRQHDRLPEALSGERTRPPG